MVRQTEEMERLRDGWGNDGEMYGEAGNGVMILEIVGERETEMTEGQMEKEMKGWTEKERGSNEDMREMDRDDRGTGRDG